MRQNYRAAESTELWGGCIENVKMLKISPLTEYIANNDCNYGTSKIPHSFYMHRIKKQYFTVSDEKVCNVDVDKLAQI